jgi:hypothetical protein
MQPVRTSAPVLPSHAPTTFNPTSGMGHVHTSSVGQSFTSKSSGEVLYADCNGG